MTRRVRGLSKAIDELKKFIRNEQKDLQRQIDEYRTLVRSIPVLRTEIDSIVAESGVKFEAGEIELYYTNDTTSLTATLYTEDWWNIDYNGIRFTYRLSDKRAGGIDYSREDFLKALQTPGEKFPI